MHKYLISVLFLVSQLAIAQKQHLSLEDAVLGQRTYLSPETLIDLSWKNDHMYTWIENGTIKAANAKNGEQYTLLTLEEANTILNPEPEGSIRNFSNYSWTNTEELLVQTGTKFFVLDIKSKSMAWSLSIPSKAENPVLSEKGRYVTYTIEDDLYVSFWGGGSLPITTDGGDGIVNGKSVHRNEFGITNGIFISPNGKYIAFYRMDESMVTDYPLVDFMSRVAEHTPVKYPMAGMKSHHVTIGIYDIATGETIFLNTGEPFDRYFTNLTWSPDEKSVYIAELNREQNHMRLNRYDVATGNLINTLFEEKHDHYVEPLTPLLFSEVNPEQFYYLSRKDGWFHVYKYLITGELKSQLTRGEWEISRIIGFSDNERYIYVEGSKENPLELHIYRVDTRNGKMDKLTNDEGVHRGLLSKNGSYILNQFSAPEIPSQTDLISGNGKKNKTIHTSPNTLENFHLGENKLVPIVSADGKTELTGRLILPLNFNPAEKYPVIVYVYGGPHSQLVEKSWLNAANWWQYYMASKGFIAFTMDNRGTNRRGRDFETSVHRQLGILETADQMRGIEYLQSLPYVDAEQIGVHGWSYGGFMTLNMMLRHPGKFKVGVAGGPVVDWSMYEIMYGERYMDMPQENPKGYHETNMLNHVQNLEGKLMLIHGVQDDVVVMQHSMQFLRECVKAGKQVDFFVYPTHPHNVRGIDRVHLMEKVSRYFIENLRNNASIEEGADIR